MVATWTLAAVGVVQFIVNAALWHANAAQARITHQQLLIANRPRVKIRWELVAGEEPGSHHLLGLVRETCGMPVVLHWATARVVVDGERPPMDPQRISRHELEGDHEALVVEIVVNGNRAVDVNVHARASTAALPETVQTWRQDIAMRVEPGASRLTVLWQSRHQITDQGKKSHSERLGDALVRAWRGWR